jgi:hypothetical protein
MFISIIIAMVMSVVFLAVFPTINSMLRSWTMPVDIIPLVGVQVALMPYVITFLALFVVVQIIRHRIQE